MDAKAAEITETSFSRRKGGDDAIKLSVQKLISDWKQKGNSFVNEANNMQTGGYDAIGRMVGFKEHPLPLPLSPAHPWPT